MNNDEGFSQGSLTEASPKLVISGKILSEKDFDKYSNFTEEDLFNIAEDWRESVPEEFKNLLDAE